MNKDSFQMIPLKDYLRLGLKPRGSGKGTLNSHFEKMISTSYSEELLSAMGCSIALSSIGNQYQTVHAVVQGFNPKNPDSGFERPVLEEGPHMVIGLYGFETKRFLFFFKKKKLHVFRTLQMRTGRLVVDTPRGFATSEMLESKEQIYTANQDQVIANLIKIMKEEAGKMEIKKISYLGADICNTSCIISKSALYAVEIDYSKFKLFSKMITAEEYTRRVEQFDHEGLIGGVIDMTVDQYLNYKENPHIVKDMTADYVSDFIIMTSKFH